MEVVGAIASFIAIGQAIGATPKIVKTLRSFTNASKELAALIGELECLYVFYEHLKGNIDLFSGEQNPALLRVEEPPYLKLVRKDLESLVVELQGLADSCLTEGANILKASRLRWWRKRRDVAKLRDECYKQRQQLQHLYMLFGDRLIHKQNQLLVHIHARIPQGNGHAPHELGPLPPLNENDLTPPDSVQDGAILAQNIIASQNPMGTTEGTIGLRCRCLCHALKTSRQSNYNLHIPLPTIGFLSYQYQRVTGNECKMNCCATTQSFVALQFLFPVFLCRLAVAGTFKFGLPLNLFMSLVPITRYSGAHSTTALMRVCYLGKAEYLNEWLSYYAASIMSVGEDGQSVLEKIVTLGGSSLLTYCTTAWPGLIKGTEMGRRAAYNARMTLIREHHENGPELYKVSASAKFDLTRFTEYMEIEDDGDDIINIICSENPIQKLDQALLDAPDMLTKQSTGGYTVLDYACLVDNAELVKHVLDLGVPFNLTDGSTPLHVAINHRAWRSARLLVRRGYPLNTSDKYGWTPLLSTIWHISKDGVEVIRFATTLLLRGADAGVQNVYNNNVWHLIHDAKSNRGDLWELYELLFKAGGARLINAKTSNGLTPLSLAIVAHNVPLISFLQKVGVAVDVVNNNGLNLLHIIALLGDSRSCQLMEELEIGCIDIRTTSNYGDTPLESYRFFVNYYHKISDGVMSGSRLLSWLNVYRDKPGQWEVFKSTAFERLLRSIRDRMLIQEINELEAIISKIQGLDLSSARDELRRSTEGKVKAKIHHEAETFRAIELDVRMGRLELAVESIEEFIEASRDRMRVSPFDEGTNPWGSSDPESGSSNDLSEDEESAVKDETDREVGVDWSSSDEDDRLDNAEGEGLEDQESDGWKTAEED
ncbi:hypothetical protein F5B21DRAFT_46870 [Xylaria acuta]|nr:hypothetical protein F5B21DRAFT_46870 [Xylaria acuta]